MKPYNIRTTVISPGAVATDLPNSMSEPDIAESIHKFYDEIAIPADSFAQAVAFRDDQTRAARNALLGQQPRSS